MTEERTPLPVVMRVIGTSARLARAELKGLSGLTPEQRDEFWGLWARIPTQRRVDIARAAAELTEDSVEYDFGELWYWLLDDADLRVRTQAVSGLWEDESRRVLRRFLFLLRNDPAEEVRTAVALGLSPFAYRSVLGEVDDDELESSIEQTLLDTIADRSQPVGVRRRALEGVGYFGNDTANGHIERAYNSQEQELRESALVAMGRSMNERWFPLIVRELASHTPALRYEAARAAGELGEDGQPLLGKLAPLLNDDDTEVALAAIWAFGQIGGAAAKRALQQLRQSSDDARSQAAEEALEELSLGEGLI